MGSLASTASRHLTRVQGVLESGHRPVPQPLPSRPASTEPQVTESVCAGTGTADLRRIGGDQLQHRGHCAQIYRYFVARVLGRGPAGEPAAQPGEGFSETHLRLKVGREEGRIGSAPGGEDGEGGVLLLELLCE